MVAYHAIHHWQPNQSVYRQLRATATGALLELDFRPEIIDRQLSHRERNEVFGAYSHQAEYMAERCRMMQAWADYLDRLQTGAAVIPLRISRTS